MSDSQWVITKDRGVGEERSPIALFEVEIDADGLRHRGLRLARSIDRSAFTLRDIKREILKQLRSLDTPDQLQEDGDWTRLTVTVFTDGTSQLCVDEADPQVGAVGWPMVELVRGAKEVVVRGEV